ncbi:MAG: DinB family protein, partial [Planctomycetota bacterium]|nr:DinB family protein [Planctomycetota bacterium]
MSQARESGRPTAQEYAPYYDAYVQRVPPGDIVATLTEQLASASALLESIPPDKAHFRYAPGKWSINELIGHLLDTEWTFTYRALRFARGDQTALAGIDQDVLVAGGD